jgi:hypothetical protein
VMEFAPPTNFARITEGADAPAVPVGTLINERPPDGSVRARLRIRLL